MEKYTIDEFEQLSNIGWMICEGKENLPPSFKNKKESLEEDDEDGKKCSKGKCKKGDKCCKKNKRKVNQVKESHLLIESSGEVPSIVSDDVAEVSFETNTDDYAIYKVTLVDGGEVYIVSPYEDDYEKDIDELLDDPESLQFDTYDDAGDWIDSRLSDDVTSAMEDAEEDDVDSEDDDERFSDNVEDYDVSDIRRFVDDDKYLEDEDEDEDEIDLEYERERKLDRMDDYSPYGDDVKSVTRHYSDPSRLGRALRGRF